MSRDDVIRAWKDPEYRESLLASGSDLPEHPAGAIELTDADLDDVAGGHTITQYPYCTTWSAFCSSWSCWNCQ